MLLLGYITNQNIPEKHERQNLFNLKGPLAVAFQHKFATTEPRCMMIASTHSLATGQVHINSEPT
jgi:hypothetical protein